MTKPAGRRLPCMGPDPVVVHLRAPCVGGLLPVRALLAAGHAVVCQLHGAPVLGDLDALARLQLLARRSGTRLDVRGADGLLGLTGLSGPLGRPAGPLRRQGRRQAEPGEQGRVEEVVDVHELPT